MAEVDRIFVVGYPKSGNTWLTRLLARALNAHVAEYTIDSTNKEVASDVNCEIERPSPVTIFKVHLTPEGCANRIPIRDKTAVVYVRRNPCAVLVSAFFYFRFNGRPELAGRVPSLRTVLRPVAWVRHLRARRRLAEFLDEFVGCGVGQHPPWNVHVRVWEEYLSKHREIPSVVVTYEDLVSDGPRVLMGIVEALNIGEASIESITAAVDAESFEKRKKEVLQSERDLTFGKAFNVRFLRSGRPEDYRTYLSPGQIQKVEASVGGKPGAAATW